MWTENFWMCKLGFKEVEEPEVKSTTSSGSCRKQGRSRKTLTSASLTTLKPLTVWVTANCGKFLKRWEYQTTLPISWETCMQVKKQQLEQDVEQQTGSKSEKKYVKPVYCHPAYLTCMQNTSWEMPDWMKHKLVSKLLGEISITSDTQMTPPSWQKARGTKEPSWWKWKRRVEKTGLKLNVKKTKIMASVPSLHGKQEGEKVGAVTDFIFLGSKITADGDGSHEIKRHLLAGRKVMTNLASIFKNRDITLLTKGHTFKIGFCSSYVWIWEFYHKQRWVPKNWFFGVMVLEKTLETPVDWKDIKSVHSKGNHP